MIEAAAYRAKCRVLDSQLREAGGGTAPPTAVGRSRDRISKSFGWTAHGRHLFGWAHRTTATEFTTPSQARGRRRSRGVESVSEFVSGGAGIVCFYNTYAVEFLAPRCSGFLRWPPRASSRAGATDAEEEWGRRGARAERGARGNRYVKTSQKTVFGRACSRVFRKKNELQPLRMSKHVLRGCERREGANSFLRFWEFAFTRPKLLGFLRRVLPGFCARSPAHVIARGGHRRGGGVGKKGGREGSAGKPLA